MKGAPRRIDHEAVRLAWNSGKTYKEIAFDLGMDMTGGHISRILQAARQEGLEVRESPWSHGGAARPGGSRADGSGALYGQMDCITCHRRIPKCERKGQAETPILSPAECCTWCGRRYDGKILRPPTSRWVWIYGTLETVADEGR